MTPHRICTFAVVTSLGLVFGGGTDAQRQQKSASHAAPSDTQYKELEFATGALAKLVERDRLTPTAHLFHVQPERTAWTVHLCQ